MPLDLQLYLVLVALTAVGLIVVFRREHREDGTLVMDIQRMREREAVDRQEARWADSVYDWSVNGL